MKCRQDVEKAYTLALLFLISEMGSGGRHWKNLKSILVEKTPHACGIGETRLCEKRRVPEDRFLRAAYSGQRKAAGGPQQLALLQAGGQEAPAVLCNEPHSNTDSARSREIKAGY